MKLLLVAALLSLAAACQDRELVYRYNTQITSGLSPASPLRAGIKLTATARTQVYCRDDEVKVQFTDVIVYKVDQPFVEVKPDIEMIPNEKLEELMGDDPAAFVKALQIPFAFKRTKGLVTGLKFADEDWVKNVKKGFIGLFEVNLEKKLLLEEHVGTISPEQTKQYTVFERSATGDCPTRYVVRPAAGDVQSVAGEKMTTVHKSRDYSRCLRVPGYRKSLFFDGIKMADSFKTDPVQHSNTVRYVMRGDVITSVVGEERIVFTPTNSPADTEEVRTTVNQTLVLYNSKPISEDSKIPDVVVSPATQSYLNLHHLEMAFITDVTEEKTNEVLKDIHESTPLGFTVDKIVTELRLAAENIKMLTSKESLSHMSVVLELLRGSHYSTVKKAFDLLSQTEAQEPKDKFAKEILWTALGNVGTESAVNFILHVCDTDAIFVNNCSWALSQLTLTATPTPEVINKLMALRHKVKDTPVINIKVHLAIGSFVHKMALQMTREHEQLEKGIAMVTPLLAEEDWTLRSMIKDKLRIMQKRQNRLRTIMSTISGKVIKLTTNMLGDKSVKERVLALKVIRNSGLVEAVPVLKEFLFKDDVKTNTPFLRLPAVLAFSKIAMNPIARAEIQGFMMKILLDTTEINEIRSAAFTVLMTLNPDLTLLEVITSRMQAEKDLHLSSYVISYLQTYANSTYEPVAELSKNASVALQSAPEYTTGTGHSFYKFAGYYNEKYRMGSSIKLAARGSMDRFMSLDFDLDTVLFGFSTTPFAMRVDTQGLSSLISKVFGPKGMKSLSSTLSNVLKTNPLKMDPKQLISDIASGLKLEPREMQAFYGQAQLHMFGQEMMYFESAKDLLQMFLPEGTSPMRMSGDTVETVLPMDVMKTFYLLDAKVMMPTEAGLPVALHTLVTHSHKVTGNVKVKATLPTEQREVNSMTLPSNIGAELDIYKKGVLGVKAYMGLDCFLAKATVGVDGFIKLDAPLKKKVVVDLSTGVMEDRLTLPQQEKPVIETYFEPVSEFLTVPNRRSSPSMVYTSRPIYAAVNHRVKRVNMTLPIPFLGQSVRVMGQTPVESFYPIPAFPLRGRSDMTLTFVPGSDPAPAMTLRVKVMTGGDDVTTPTEQPNTAVESDYQNDIIDLPRLTLPMLVRKVSALTGRPAPLSPGDSGLVVTLDASTGAVTRKIHLEALSQAMDTTSLRTVRVWFSAVPGWFTEPFQLLGEFHVKSSPKVHEPEDIFSIEWQRTLMNDFKLITQTESQTKSFKISDEILKMTMASFTEQIHQPTLDLQPAKSSMLRIMDNLVPLIYTSNKMKTPIPERSLAIFIKAQEEVKMINDPYLIKRDGIVLDLITDLIDCVQTKLNNLKYILKNKSIKFIDVVSIETVLMNIGTVMMNEKTMTMLHDIVGKYKASGAVTRMEEIKPLLDKCSGLLTEVQTLVDVDPFKSLISELSETVSDGSVSDLPIFLVGEEEDKIRELREGMLDIKREARRLFNLNSSLVSNVTLLGDEMEMNTFNLLIGETIIKFAYTLVFANDQLELHGASRPSLMLAASAMEAAATISHVTKLFRQRLVSLTTPKRLTWIKRLDALSFDLSDVVPLISPLFTKQSQDFVSFTRRPENLERFQPKPVQSGLFDHWSSGNTTRTPETRSTTPLEILKDRPSQAEIDFMNMIRKCRFLVDQIVTNKDLMHKFSIRKEIYECENVFQNDCLFDIFYGGRFYFNNNDFTFKKIYNCFAGVLVIDKCHALDGNNKYADKMDKMNKYADLMTGIKLSNSNGEVFPSKVPSKHVESTQELMIMCQELMKLLKHNINLIKKPSIRMEIDICKSQGLMHENNKYKDLMDKTNKYATTPLEILKDVLPSIVPYSNGAINNGLSVVDLKEIGTCKDLMKIIKNNRHGVNRRSMLSAMVKCKSHLLRINKDKPNLYFKNEYTDLMNDINEYLGGGRYLEEEIPSGVVGHLNITWGASGMMDKSILLKGFSSRSVEQILWFMKQLKPSTMHPDLTAAITARMTGQVALKPAFKDVFNTYNHIYIEATASDMPRWLRESAISVQEMLKVNLWDFYTRHQVSQPGDAGKITAEIDVSELNDKVDFYLQTKGESDVFVNVPIYPAVFKALKPTQTLRPVSEQLMEFVSGGFTPATCSFHGNQVTTLDTVSYILPETLTRCRSLLAMDCSRDKTFAVTVGPSERGAKTLEISSLRRVVQVTAHDQTVEIVVDGEPITVDNKTHVLEQDLLIHKPGPRHVIVNLPRVGVTVTVKGVVVVLEVSQMFKSKVCGLCGNFDGQKSWEFEGPLREIYQNTTSFALSYVVPSPACPASLKPALVPSDLYQVPKPGHVRAGNGNIKDSGIGKGKQCSKNFRTKVKKFRKKDLVCFSSKPVSECSFDCSGDKIVYNRTKILFTCLDGNSRVTHQMLRLARSGRVVTEEKLEKHAQRKIYRKTTMEDNCMV